MNNKRKWGTGKVALILLIGISMGLLISARFDFTEKVHAWWGSDEAKRKTQEKAGPPVEEKKTDAAPLSRICLPDFTQLAEHIDPCVVNISTMQTVKGHGMLRGFRGKGQGQQQFGPKGRNPLEDFFEYFGIPRGNMKRRSLGSGFIIDKTGYIVTNNHVIQAAESITVIFKDESEVEAKVIGRDPKTDLALIKVDVDKDLPAAPLGNSDQLEVGDWVLAIGNPFGCSGKIHGLVIDVKESHVSNHSFAGVIETDLPGGNGFFQPGGGHDLGRSHRAKQGVFARLGLPVCTDMHFGGCAPTQHDRVEPAVFGQSQMEAMFIPMLVHHTGSAAALAVFPDSACIEP